MASMVIVHHLTTLVIEVTFVHHLAALIVEVTFGGVVELLVSF